ncbi:pilin [Marinomonas sp. 15G1-11]|uniref:Pilin n=1 Tax=Marinomonas phaeophyticola TaxID=3004091 RepID=A0ABT4JRM0_9GAMM|nr:pilin [Marinomonas sp. 15G1-11]MCZ2720468.1 pilin [Marinomonas sp. 15G1-11]
MKKTTTLRAFTLIELLVVITIISILASFGAPQLIQKIAKAKLLEVYSYSNGLQTAIEEIILTTGSFPNSTQFESLKTSQNLSDNSIITSASIEQAQGITGTVKIELKEENGIEANQYFLFSRTITAKWDCSSTLPKSLLSEHCRNINNEGHEDDND